MSAEGILADPCIFLRGRRTQIPSHPSAPSSSSGSVCGETGVSSGEDAIGCMGSSISSGCLSTDRYRDKDRDKERERERERDKDRERDRERERERDRGREGHREGQWNGQRDGPCSEGDEDSDDRKIGRGIEIEMEGTGPGQGSSEGKAEADREAEIPDRAALFAEYCSLSRMFYTAGGWSNLGQRDSTFDGDGEKDPPSSSSSSSSTCPFEDVCVAGASFHCPSHSDSRGNRDVLNGCSGTAASATVTGCDISSTNSPTASATAAAATAAAAAADSSGCEKQIETARQHLFWMLGKRGHGRTVRFTHRGPYKMHTDLLHRVKDAVVLEELEWIAGVCLQGVYGSTVYSDDVCY
jgi:hypothetical protein